MLRYEAINYFIKKMFISPVRRMPCTKQDHFHKFAQASTTSQLPYEYQSMLPEELVTEGTAVNVGGGNLSYELDPINESGSREKFDEEATLVISTEKYEEPTVEVNTEVFGVNIQSLEHSIPCFVHTFQEDSTSKGYSDEPSLPNDTEILNFLPVDVLKSVHRTLKSQSTSSEGKMLFLKAFEKTLMTEIGIGNLN